MTNHSIFVFYHTSTYLHTIRFWETRCRWSASTWSERRDNANVVLYEEEYSREKSVLILKACVKNHKECDFYIHFISIIHFYSRITNFASKIHVYIYIYMSKYLTSLLWFLILRIEWYMYICILQNSLSEVVPWLHWKIIFSKKNLHYFYFRFFFLNRRW